jgi:hypothetical protein
MTVVALTTMLQAQLVVQLLALAGNLTKNIVSTSLDWEITSPSALETAELRSTTTVTFVDRGPSLFMPKDALLTFTSRAKLDET